SLPAERLARALRRSAGLADEDAGRAEDGAVDRAAGLGELPAVIAADRVDRIDDLWCGHQQRVRPDLVARPAVQLVAVLVQRARPLAGAGTGVEGGQLVAVAVQL